MSTNPNEHISARPVPPAPSAPAVRPTPSRWKTKRGLHLALAVLIGFAIGMGGVAYTHGWYGKIFAKASTYEDLGPVRVFDRAAPGAAPEGMVWVPGGVFWMGMGEREIRNGHSQFYAAATPRHKVLVDGFWMDKTEVTNAQFDEFVKATKYVTYAEQWPDASELTGVLPKYMKFKAHQAHIFAFLPCAGFPAAVPWAALQSSGNFFPPSSCVLCKPVEMIANPLHHPVDDWWEVADGVNWRYPEGQGKGDWITMKRQNYPVVHVSYDDAVAYCKWKDRRLPTEAEWEFAARGGLDRKLYCWGDELQVNGKWMANTWQGAFPNTNTKLDDHEGLAPVGYYPANAFGLKDMAGNAWEWVADLYDPNYYVNSPQRNPQGPQIVRNDKNPDYIIRGGSFACSENYCKSYVPGARRPAAKNSTLNHLGFRCAKSP